MPTSVIPGVPALLCIVTLVIASRQLEIVFLPVLQLCEVIRSYHRKISSFLLQYLNSVNYNRDLFVFNFFQTFFVVPSVATPALCKTHIGIEIHNLLVIVQSFLHVLHKASCQQISIYPVILPFWQKC